MQASFPDCPPAHIKLLESKTKLGPRRVVANVCWHCPADKIWTSTSFCIVWYTPLKAFLPHPLTQHLYNWTICSYLARLISSKHNIIDIYTYWRPTYEVSGKQAVATVGNWPNGTGVVRRIIATSSAKLMGIECWMSNNTGNSILLRR